MSLALLSDDRYARLYTAAHRTAIRRHIPWTRRVRPELAEDIAKRRETLVLKPNDEYGGKGVVLGWTVDQAEGGGGIAIGRRESYAVRQAAEVRGVPFLLVLEGQV